jgi:hypothetical protein
VWLQLVHRWEGWGAKLELARSRQEVGKESDILEVRPAERWELVALSLGGVWQCSATAAGALGHVMPRCAELFAQVTKDKGEVFALQLQRLAPL